MYFSQGKKCIDHAKNSYILNYYESWKEEDVISKVPLKKDE